MSEPVPFAVLVDLDGAGSHPGAARSPAARDAASPARALVEHVRAAERAGFTAVTFADGLLSGARDAPGIPDAVVRASFAAPGTGAIGLIPVVSGLYTEPFHVSTQLSSLDTLSAGRAGVVLAADPDPRLAARYGREPLSAGDADGEFADVVEVLRRLWDSWEDDAVIRDVPTGRYLDRAKLHYADFEGRHFSVKGPAITPRPPQGQPLVIAAAGTAAEVDAVLIDVPVRLVGGTTASAELTDAIAAAAANARATAADGTRVLLELEVVLDRAGRTGAKRLAALDAVEPWAAGRARYVGAADGLAALIGELTASVDGVRLLPAVTATDLDELGRAVLPRLRTGAVFTSPRAGATLRETLGLARPTNRAVSAATSEEHAR